MIQSVDFGGRHSTQSQEEKVFFLHKHAMSPSGSSARQESGGAHEIDSSTAGRVRSGDGQYEKDAREGSRRQVRLETPPKIFCNGSSRDSHRQYTDLGH